MYAAQKRDLVESVLVYDAIWEECAVREGRGIWTVTPRTLLSKELKVDEC